MYVDPTLFGAPWVDQLQNAQPAVRMQGQPKRLRIDAAGKVVPGDEPAEGDWRSLAPARQQGPSMQKATNDYLSGDTSGMLQRAQAGDAAAIDAMLRRAQEDGQRAANATRLPFGLGIFDQAHSPAAQAHLAAQANAQLAPLVDQAAKAPVDAFLKAMGLGEQAFQGDTKRAEAALQEYGAKVRGPQQDALALQLEREKGVTQKSIAEMARKGSIEAAFAGAAAQRAMDPNSTPEERRAARDSLKEMREGVNPGPGGVRITGEQPPVKIDTGGPAQAAGGKSEDAFDKMERATREGKAQRDLIAQAFGKTFTPQGQATGGKFDPAAIAAALAGRADVTPDQIKALVNEARSGAYGSGDKLIADAARHLHQLARQSGNSRSVGDISFSGGFSPFGFDSATMTIPDLGSLTFGTAPRFFPTTPRLSAGGREESAKQATALAGYLRKLIEAGRPAP
jgi:hypothetical protein